jgi:ubiquinone/menaquinone biosynthesis C-methylase UbiE
MQPERKNRVCPAELAGSLDMAIRRWLQNPPKILSPFIHEGMTVLDLGCGPGFFSLDMARLVGRSGRVIAVDLQQSMLARVRKKIQGTGLENRFTLQQCGEEIIGIRDRIDFALAFYMVHEIPDQDSFFRQLAALLKPEGKMLVVEPPLHVSRSDFEKTLEKARCAGFRIIPGPKVFLSKTAVLIHGEQA